MLSSLPESFDDLLKCMMVFLLGGLLAFFVGRQLKLSPYISLSLYLWHTAFCLVFVNLLVTRGGDALGYYARSFDRFVVFDLGTSAVVAGTSILTTGLGLSLLACSLFYNIFGALGLLFFAAALRGEFPKWKWQHFVVILLPSVSFWSASIGKDAISFLSVSLFAWAVVITREKLWPFLVSILLMGLVRPHIAVMIAATVAGAAVLNIKRSPVRGTLALIGGVGGAAILLPIVMQTMSLETLGIDDLGDMIEGREGANMRGGSSIDISGMPVWLKVFSYLFRPLPFEAKDSVQLINGVENVILLIIAIYGFYAVLRQFEFRRFVQNLPLLVLGLATLLLLALTTANLGIAVRQKWMTLIPFVVFLFAFLEARTNVRGRRPFLTDRKPMMQQKGSAAFYGNQQPQMFAPLQREQPRRRE